MAVPSKCTIEKRPVYREIEGEVADLKAAGDSHGTIAAKLGTNIETVQNAVKSANGKPPRIYAKKKRGAASTTPRITYRDIASEVLLLHFSG